MREDLAVHNLISSQAQRILGEFLQFHSFTRRPATQMIPYFEKQNGPQKHFHSFIGLCDAEDSFIHFSVSSGKEPELAKSFDSLYNQERRDS